MYKKRTEYDTAMQKLLSAQKYHTQPFPGYRSDFDQDLQKTWCTVCNTKENYGKEKMPIDVAFRTEYDKDLQKKWCKYKSW